MNSILFLCLSIFTLLILLGILWPPALVIAAFCHLIGVFAYLGCTFSTGVLRHSDDGTECAKRETPATLEANGSTFKDHGALIQSLWTVMIVFFLLYTASIVMALHLSKESSKVVWTFPWKNCCKKK